jgi:hypothetical protein
MVIAWHMLKANELYRYAQPQTVDAKLEQLRVTANGCDAFVLSLRSVRVPRCHLLEV